MSRTLSKAIKAASSPEARAKAVATMKRNRELKKAISEVAAMTESRGTVIRRLGAEPSSERLEIASRLLSILDRLV